MATDFSGANDFNILSQAPSAFVSADSSLTLRPTDRQGSPHAGVPVPTVEGATVHDKLAQNGQVNWRNLRQFRSAYTGFVEPWLRVEGRHGPALATRQCPEVSAHFEQKPRHERRQKWDTATQAAYPQQSQPRRSASGRYPLGYRQVSHCRLQSFLTAPWRFDAPYPSEPKQRFARVRQQILS
jgi:hypothetical protein